MENKFNISLVIPLYNKEDAILKTIDSVLKQTYSDFEVIVVDDGSKDNSLRVVQSIEDPRLRVIHKENGGVSSARNRGIREAKGDYIALLDGDDLWEPTFLEEQIRLIHDFPNAGMWGVNTAFIKHGKKQKWEQDILHTREKNDAGFYIMNSINQSINQSILFIIIPCLYSKGYYCIRLSRKTMLLCQENKY